MSEQEEQNLSPMVQMDLVMIQHMNFENMTTKAGEMIAQSLIEQQEVIAQLEIEQKLDELSLAKEQFDKMLNDSYQLLPELEAHLKEPNLHSAPDNLELFNSVREMVLGKAEPTADVNVDSIDSVLDANQSEVVSMPSTADIGVSEGEHIENSQELESSLVEEPQTAEQDWEKADVPLEAYASGDYFNQHEHDAYVPVDEPSVQVLSNTNDNAEPLVPDEAIMTESVSLDVESSKEDSIPEEDSITHVFEEDIEPSFTKDDTDVDFKETLNESVSIDNDTADAELVHENDFEQINDDTLNFEEDVLSSHAFESPTENQDASVDNTESKETDNIEPRKEQFSEPPQQPKAAQSQQTQQTTHTHTKTMFGSLASLLMKKFQGESVAPSIKSHSAKSLERNFEKLDGELSKSQHLVKELVEMTNSPETAEKYKETIAEKVTDFKHSAKRVGELERGLELSTLDSATHKLHLKDTMKKHNEEIEQARKKLEENAKKLSLPDLKNSIEALTKFISNIVRKFTEKFSKDKSSPAMEV